MRSQEFHKEEQRLRSLGDYRILDTVPEVSFDRIVELAAGISETPIALFSLVDEHRQWFKSRVGLDAPETSRAVSFCSHAVAADDWMIVEDATKDPRFADNPLVRGEPDIRFYAGVPIHSKEHFALGTLCVIDKVPRTLSKENRLLLESLAREIEAQLEIRRILIDQQRLLEERAILTNMVVHDARGVFHIMGWCLDTIRKKDRKDEESLQEFQDSIKVLRQLFEGVARINEHSSRGLVASSRPTDLRPWFESTVARATTAANHEGMNIDAHYEIPEREVNTDTDLLERIIGNLCSNAMEACSAGATIGLHARMASDDAVVLAVEDDGPGVRTEDVQNIFDPYFSRRESRQQGSGLGLAICRLASQALGGTIEYVPREPTGARFVVRLPADAAGPASH